MGNKSGRTGKYILYYIAVSCIITAVNIVGCASVQDKIAEINTHQQLEQYRKNMADGSFATVVQQGKQVVEKNETAPPAEVALYALGEVYAHHDYDGRDYVLSQYYFEKLIKNFPDSQLTSEAKVYISLFEIIAVKEKAVVAVKQKSLQREMPIVKDKEKKIKPAILARKVVEDQNFEEAVKKNVQILDKVGKERPAEEALYNLGLIYAHGSNPAKDYAKSQNYFHQLTKQFPDSELAEEALIWLGVFETIEKIQRIDIDIDLQKKQLNN